MEELNDIRSLLGEAQGLIVSVGIDPDFLDLPDDLVRAQIEACSLISQACSILNVLDKATS